MGVAPGPGRRGASATARATPLSLPVRLGAVGQARDYAGTVEAHRAKGQSREPAARAPRCPPSMVSGLCSPLPCSRWRSARKDIGERGRRQVVEDRSVRGQTSSERRADSSRPRLPAPPPGLPGLPERHRRLGRLNLRDIGHHPNRKRFVVVRICRVGVALSQEVERFREVERRRLKVERPPATDAAIPVLAMGRKRGGYKIMKPGYFESVQGLADHSVRQVDKAVSTEYRVRLWKDVSCYVSNLEKIVGASFFFPCALYN
jgi:hypothetical protein